MRNANKKKEDMTVLSSSQLSCIWPEISGAEGRHCSAQTASLLHPVSCFLQTGLREVLEGKSQESFFCVAQSEVIDHS